MDMDVAVQNMQSRAQRRRHSDKHSCWKVLMGSPRVRIVVGAPGDRQVVGGASPLRIGQPLSLENILSLGVEAVDKTEGDTDGREIASTRTALAAGR